MNANTLHNSLALGKSHRKTQRRKPKKVTIALGVICGKKGVETQTQRIVLASDSQTTYGATKSLNAKKIRIVNFADAQILVAQAGTAALADAAIEVFQDKAAAVKLENKDTVARVAEEAVREIRNHLIEINRDLGLSDDGKKRLIFEENYFELLIAYFYDDVPYLRTVNIDWCRAIASTEPFTAIGSGKAMADFLLQEYRQADPDFESGRLIAAATVEKTIDTVDGCGRPTWLGTVYTIPKAYYEAEAEFHAAHKIPNYTPYGHCRAALLNKEYVDLMVEELRDAESQEIAAKKAKLAQTIARIESKYSAKIDKELAEALKKIDVEE